MRRAMRHAQILGARDPLMWRLVPALTREMGQAYPELIRAEALITETLQLEETRFRATLARGLAILEDETRELPAGGKLAGEIAFKLYDTYGFPLDLTQDALRARGLGVDADGFARAMERQRAEARKAWAGSGEAATETVWFALRDRLGATEFLGYETEVAEGVVEALVMNGSEVASLPEGEKGVVILNQTPFYAESGGQVGDIGVMIGAGVRVRVLDTKKKLGDLFVHEIEVEQGTLRTGSALELKVDHAARSATRANHSATHLLHEALRIVLGDHVAQKGSLVSPDRLRFDIAHPKPITAAEITAVEDIANRIVLQNEPVITRLMGLEEARNSGARALFGEKYGDEVRVVSMGTIEAGDNGPRPYSVELCGGTHVRRTGDIGLVSIIGESAVAAGVRRIEARTRDEARKRLTEDSHAFAQLAALLRAPAGEAAQRLENLLEDKRKLERELADARRKLAMGGGAPGGDAVRDVAGVKLYARAVTGVEMKDLKSLADEAKASLGSGIVAIVATGEEGKASLVVAVTADMTARFNAVDLVRLGSAALGGKGGGGRPDMAQAGGPDGEKAKEALAAVEAGIRAKAAG
jgi:alanyl-tRNA synthetase